MQAQFVKVLNYICIQKIMAFTLTILGSNSAAPTSERNSSAQLLDTGKGGRFLLDCAEATQIQLRRFKTRLLNIDVILITHLHGDHFFGLPGLLTTWHLLGRKKEVRIFAPEGLEELLNHIFSVSGAHLSYPVKVTAIDPEQHSCIYENAHIRVYTLPLIHRVPCCGYLIRETLKERAIIRAKIEEYALNWDQIRNLKANREVLLEDGRTLSPEEATHPPVPPLSYAYCTDTAWNEALIPMLNGVHTVFHEATFMNADQHLAREKFHATAGEAARIALGAGAKQLLIGHFSSRYKNLSPMLAEAQEIFPDTLLASDGLSITLNHEYSYRR